MSWKWSLLLQLYTIWACSTNKQVVLVIHTKLHQSQRRCLLNAQAGKRSRSDEGMSPEPGPLRCLTHSSHKWNLQLMLLRRQRLRWHHTRPGLLAKKPDSTAVHLPYWHLSAWLNQTYVTRKEHLPVVSVVIWMSDSTGHCPFWNKLCICL